MTKEELLTEINKFAKQIIIHILRDYQYSLGLENELRLRDLLTKDFVILDTVNNNNIEDGLVHIFIDKEDLIGLTNEEMLIKIKKDILVREIFRYIITPKLPNEVNEHNKKFADDLTEGLVAKYALDFSLRHDLGKPDSKCPENIALATKLLEGMPKDISKDALFFQYQYPFMLDYYKIGTGKSLLDEYFEGKNIDISKPAALILEKKENNQNSYQNGFLKGTYIIITCLLLGVFLAYLLVR